jgi:hypothetical protein
LKEKSMHNLPRFHNKHPATLLLAILLLAVAFSQLAALASANPIGMFPTQPEPLIVTLQSPKNASRCLQEQMSIVFTLQNPTLGGAHSITYAVDGQNRGDVNGKVTAKEGERFLGFYDKETYSAIVSLSGLPDGWHILTVNAAGESPYSPDKGLNSIIADVYGSDSITFLFDTRTPNITIFSPQNQTYRLTVLPLNFSISEKADWIGYSLDSQTPTTISGNGSLTGLPQGNHQLTLYANDTIGRKGTSETINFSITEAATTENDSKTEPEPIPYALVASVSGAAAAIAAGAVYYFRKRIRNA